MSRLWVGFGSTDCWLICKGTHSIEGFRYIRSLGGVMEIVACGVVCAVVSIRVSGPELTSIQSNRKDM